MRQLAWLQTAQQDKNGKPLPSRISTMREQGDAPEVPLITTHENLIEYLMDAGPVLRSAQGAAALTHSEIRAWMANVGQRLTAWETQTLRILSAAYLQQALEAQAPDCPPPWQEAATEETREHVAKKVQSAFQLLMKTRPKRKP